MPNPLNPTAQWIEPDTTRGAKPTGVYLADQGSGEVQIVTDRGAADRWLSAHPGEIQITETESEQMHRLLQYGNGTVVIVEREWRNVHLILPGTSGNYASTPDTAAVSVTGDIDLRADVAPDDWTPSTTNEFISKFGSSGNRSYRMILVTTTLRLQVTEGGVTTIEAQSTETVPFSDGERGSVRATLDASTGDVTFYTSTDFETWTQLGSVVSTAASSIFDSTADVNVGGSNAFAAGKVYGAQVYDGIDGTLVADLIPADGVPGDEWTSSTAGEVWTINGSDVKWGAS